jgi:pyridoxal phosphate enzyme (YggS family)
MGIAENLALVQERIHTAERRAGRPEGSVRLMAVSKFHPAESVLAAAAAGQKLFGENRVQEAVPKFDSVQKQCGDISLHLIGTLQRNKVRHILPLAGCIQSVDRDELLLEIEKQAALIDKTVSVLFEFHTGEESKAGYADRDSLFRSIDLLAGLPHIRCEGLMTMAPFTGDHDIVRASFRSLFRIREECRNRWSTLSFDVLSMGMSSDYEIAIEEGSTLVRIGTAIFGERA